MTKRATVALVVGLVVALCAAMAIAASGKPSTRNDVTSTRSYLRARSALLHAMETALPASRKAGDHFVTKLLHTCPSVLVGAPIQREEFFLEASSATIVATQRPLLRSFARFTQGVRGLRWSRSRLTSLVRATARAEEERAEVVPPDPCVDMKAWVASRYQTLPFATTRFLHRLEVISAPVEREGASLGTASRSVGSVILGLLPPYESTGEKQSALDVARLEAAVLRPYVDILLRENARLTGLSR